MLFHSAMHQSDWKQAGLQMHKATLEAKSLVLILSSQFAPGGISSSMKYVTGFGS